LLAWSYV